MASPLGRYSELAAMFTALGIIGVWLFVQVGVLVAPNGGALDAAATLAIGIILGQRSTTNGAGKIAAVANSRIDELERRFGVTLRPTVVPDAPPADNGGG